MRNEQIILLLFAQPGRVQLFLQKGGGASEGKRLGASDVDFN